jgi:glycosyltransferase 2 family protein
LNTKIKTTLRISIFAFTGIFLFWLVYRGQPVDKITEALRNANYYYIALSLVIAFASHWSRAVRWNILINAMGYKPKAANTLLAVLIMYLSNTAIPRSGEITRCGILKKYEKIPFTQLIGTVIVERVFDFLMLFVLLAVVLATQYGVIGVFIENNPETGKKLSFLLNTNFWIVGFLLFIAGMVALYFVFKKLKNFFLIIKLKEFFKNIVFGIKTVKNLEKKWQFIFHSVFIWTCYFLMIYTVFLSFEFTSHLTLLTGLTVFVMASFGMVAPSPGGIGTWHFMVIETLVIYGIQKSPDASAFAFAAHGSMTLWLVILGLVSLVLLPVINKNSPNVLAENNNAISKS